MVYGIWYMVYVRFWPTLGTLHCSPPEVSWLLGHTRDEQYASPANVVERLPEKNMALAMLASWVSKMWVGCENERVN
jgi:hypothetical protein